MKTSLRNRFRLSALAAGLGLILPGQATAQTFTTLYSFSETENGTNSDGADLYAGLILSGNTLYGTATAGGSWGYGTVFAVNTDGTGFTTLHSFTGGSGGGNPFAGLILSGNTLYGTASGDVSNGSGEYADGSSGTVFAVNTDGTGFTNLHSFTAMPAFYYTNSDGANPFAGLILSGKTLYGTTFRGGSWGVGTVFALNTDGTGFTTLHGFNGDGAQPWTGLILSGNTLYGTAYYGGSWGWGTVFALNTNGTGFTTLHSFTAAGTGPNYTNSDGASPQAGLTLSGNTLYGTSSEGGSAGHGTVFAVNTKGTGFTTLHSFTGDSYAGNQPAGLILSGNTLYGTTAANGTGGGGTVFAVNTDGTGFTNLAFAFRPYGALILSGNTLYGTESYGAISSSGTVFSLTLPGPPQLTIIPSGANVILTWPTNAAGFTLQSTTNLLSPAAWTTNSPAPVVVSGQNTVTNPTSGAQQFFRLSQ